ncbi:MAG TPA: energy transducer TonB [Vicinamibacterales bacterium]
MRFLAVAILVAAQAGGAKYSPARALNAFLPISQPPMAVAGGEVLLEVLVDARGGIRDVQTLRATPPFTTLVLDAVRTWNFAPATLANPNEKPREVESSVLVAGVFRPPAIYNQPGLGDPPKTLKKPSDRVPFPTQMTMPAYPPQALFDGIVLLEVGVTPAGTVSEARIIGSGSGFEKVSLEAVRDWRFTPTKNPSYVYVIFGFRQPVI